MKPSYLTFVRKRLKVKGRSIHNGRGGYDCDCTNASSEELFERAMCLVEKLYAKNLIESVDATEDQLHFVMKEEADLANPYYRGFCFSKQREEFGCHFTIPSEKNRIKVS